MSDVKIKQIMVKDRNDGFLYGELRLQIDSLLYIIIKHSKVLGLDRKYDYCDAVTMLVYHIFDKVVYDKAVENFNDVNDVIMEYGSIMTNILLDVNETDLQTFVSNVLRDTNELTSEFADVIVNTLNDEKLDSVLNGLYTTSVVYNLNTYECGYANIVIQMKKDTNDI